MLVPKSIMVVVVGRFELHVHEEDRRIGGRHEEDLHERVVGRDVSRDQIEISRRVNDRKENLRLAADT